MNKTLATLIGLSLIPLAFGFFARTTSEPQDMLGGGTGTIGQLEQFKSSGGYITQNQTGKQIKLTGYESSGDCLITDASGVVSTSTCGTGSSGSSNWTLISGGLRTSTSTDFAQASYFVATSTTATSTFAGDIAMTHGHYLVTHGIRGDASDGLYVQANNGTNVADFGLGNSSNATFYGGVNIDGQTRIATSVTGLVKAVSGVLSAASAGTDYEVPLTVSGGLTRTVNNIAPTTGYTIPLTASTTEWNTFYTTPSNRITAGTNLSWSGNTLNAIAGADGVSNWSYNGSRLSPTTTVGIGVFASSTIGGSTGATGLTVNGGATTTLDMRVNGLTVGKGFNSGAANTALGVDALAITNSGNGFNTAIGYGSLDSNTSGYSNTGIGYNTLGGNTSGIYNTAIGADSTGLSVTTGSFNTAIGGLSLISQTTGTGTVAIGYNAGRYNSTESNNFFLNNTDRGSLTGDKSGSLMYGTFNATPSSQTLSINASTSVFSLFNKGFYRDSTGSVGAQGEVLASTVTGTDWVATSTLFSSIGTVTSVGMTVPTGLTISGSPVTTSGTLAVALDTGYTIPTTTRLATLDAFTAVPSTVITAGNHIDWSGNTLNVVTTGDWTGTLDGYEASSLLGTSNWLCGTWCTPSSTLGIIVNASSTIGNGTLGLTVAGSATTTGTAYFGGNVGIGMSNPSSLLQVGNSTIGARFQPINTNTLFAMGVNTSDGSDNQGFVIQGGGLVESGLDTRGGYINVRGNEMSTSGGEVRVVAGNVSTGNIALYTAGAEKMTVANSGNVGIGDTTPSQLLSVGSGDLFTVTSAGNFNAPNGTTTVSFFSELGTFTNAVIKTLLTAVNVTITGLLDIGAGVLEIPNGTAPTVDSVGELALDTTSNQLVLYGTEKKVIGNGNFYPAFTYATSTAWTGTTTIPLGTAFVAETWNAVQCFTDTGTLNVSFTDGTNRMNAMNASTTVGTVTLSTNNTFTASEKRYVEVGTPASSPTKISCTISKSLTAD